MLKRLSYTFKVAAVVVVFALPLLVLGQGGYDSPIQAKTIDQILDVIIKFAVGIITPLSALAVMVAAFLYITAGGSEERVKQGHKALTYGVIGIAIVLSAQFLKDVVIGIAGGATRAENLARFLENVVRAFGAILMGISVLAVFYSAFLFLTGGGSQEKVETARRVLTYALVGVAVALLAFAIPALVKLIISVP